MGSFHLIAPPFHQARQVVVHVVKDHVNAAPEAVAFGHCKRKEFRIDQLGPSKEATQLLQLQKCVLLLALKPTLGADNLLETDNVLMFQALQKLYLPNSCYWKALLLIVHTYLFQSHLLSCLFVLCQEYFSVGTFAYLLFPPIAAHSQQNFSIPVGPGYEGLLKEVVSAYCELVHFSKWPDWTEHTQVTKEGRCKKKLLKPIKATGSTNLPSMLLQPPKSASPTSTLGSSTSHWFAAACMTALSFCAVSISSNMPIVSCTTIQS